MVTAWVIVLSVFLFQGANSHDEKNLRRNIMAAYIPTPYAHSFLTSPINARNDPLDCRRDERYCNANTGFCMRHNEGIREETCAEENECSPGQTCYLPVPCRLGAFRLCSSNPCSSNPCQNSGTCITSGTHYYCQCPPGYTTESNCVQHDACHAVPCKNAGSCTVIGGGYQCQCHLGFDDDSDCGFDCRPGPAEIVFVVDSSESIKASFNQSKNFISNFVSRLPIGGKDFHFALITYSTNPHVEFTFDSFNTTAAILSAIDALKSHSPGATYTDPALQKAFQLLTNSGRTAYKYIVLLSDGLSTDRQQAIQRAQFIRNYGVKIYAIGVGNDIEQQELLDKASTSPDFGGIPHVFSWTQTDDLYFMLLNQTVNPDCGNCTLQTNTEILLILDATMTQMNFELAKDTMILFSEHSTIPNTNVKTGMISAGSGVKIEYLPHINNTKCCDTCTLRSCINKARGVLNESTNVTKALEDSAMTGFLPGNTGGRRILILFSDGHWQDKQRIRSMIDSLQTRNISVATVAIGTDAGLDTMLSVTFDSNLVFYIDNKTKVNQLLSLMSRIFHVKCIGNLFG